MIHNYNFQSCNSTKVLLCVCFLHPLPPPTPCQAPAMCPPFISTLGAPGLMSLALLFLPQPHRCVWDPFPDANKCLATGQRGETKLWLTSSGLTPDSSREFLGTFKALRPTHDGAAHTLPHPQPQGVHSLVSPLLLLIHIPAESPVYREILTSGCVEEEM